MVKIKRVYDPPSDGDGKRVLVDRLWPRGLTKERAKIDAWIREVAPSTGLRKWFGHDPARWNEFRRRFFSELQASGETVDGLVKTARRGRVTLLFGSKEGRYNNAVALKEFIEARMNAAKREKAA